MDDNDTTNPSPLPIATPPFADAPAPGTRVGRAKPQLPVPAIKDWQRALKKERSINDLVEDILTWLMANDSSFKDYLDALYDEQAVEGSLAADNFMAAMKIRARAKDQEIDEISTLKLATINHALGVVLRRYKLSRKQRKLTVDGQIVANGDDE